MDLFHSLFLSQAESLSLSILLYLCVRLSLMTKNKRSERRNIISLARSLIIYISFSHAPTHTIRNTGREKEKESKLKRPCTGTYILCVLSLGAKIINEMYSAPGLEHTKSCLSLTLILFFYLLGLVIKSLVSTGPIKEKKIRERESGISSLVTAIDCP